jgi:AraC-like DNA-binding protein
MSLLYSALQPGQEGRQEVARAIHEAMRRMADPTQETPPLPKLARQLGVSYTWFRRAFVHHTGLSPHQYRLQLRVGRARALLSETSLTVKEVAFRSGFESEHYFCRLFKSKTGALFPAWMRRAEQMYFMALVVLIFQTFLADDHRAPIQNPWFLLTLSVTGGLFCAILYGYATALRAAPKRSALAAPFGYLMLQSAAAGMSVYSTALYLFALAMHYVEYHVLMVPRCFNSPVDCTKRIDRWYDRFRSHKLVFYLVLLAFSGLYFWLGQSRLTTGAPAGASRGPRRANATA